jgi:hypothetical protein
MGKVIYPDFFPYLCETPYGPVSCFDGDLIGFMRMYWRVKTWKVTATLTGYTNPDGSIILPGPGDYVFTYGWDAQTEKDLVCPRQFILLSGDTSWDEYTFSFYWALQSENGYEPGFDLFIRPGDDASDAETAIDREGVDNWAPVTINIDNFGSDIMSLTYYTTTASNKWGAISLKVEAESYWSYGGTYNTETGEPL